MVNSSRFARSSYLTFHVMDGKSGNDRGKSGNEMARWAAKAARLGAVAALSMPLCARLRLGKEGVIGAVCGCSRCWRRVVAPRE
jgi:hypothetical protein